MLLPLLDVVLRLLGCVPVCIIRHLTTGKRPVILRSGF